MLLEMRVQPCFQTQDYVDGKKRYYSDSDSLVVKIIFQKN